jgi:hypothetical protein
MEKEANADELTYEPVGESELDSAVGIILESLRRHQPTRIIC